MCFFFIFLSAFSLVYYNYLVWFLRNLIFMIEEGQRGLGGAAGYLPDCRSMKFRAYEELPGICAALSEAGEMVWQYGWITMRLL